MIELFRYAHFSNKSISNKLKGMIEHCDTLLIESGVGDNYAILKKSLNELSFRGYTDTSLMSHYEDGGSAEELKDAIRNCGKPIEAERSPVTAVAAMRQDKTIRDSQKMFIKGNFEEAYKTRLDGLEQYTKMYRLRESSITSQLLDMQNENPGWTILFPVGCGHLIYNRLKASGAQVRQTLSDSAVTMDYGSEFARRRMLGMPNPPEIVGRAFTDELVFGCLQWSDAPIEAISRTLRETSERLSLADIRELSEYLGADVSRQSLPVEATYDWLKKRGIAPRI